MIEQWYCVGSVQHARALFAATAPWLIDKCADMLSSGAPSCVVMRYEQRGKRRWSVHRAENHVRAAPATVKKTTKPALAPPTIGFHRWKKTGSDSDFGLVRVYKCERCGKLKAHDCEPNRTGCKLPKKVP